MVTHIWLTVAANEYGWPRLLRLRIYYDGSATPSVDAPVGDFFGVGHGFERDNNSLMVRDSSSGRSRNCYWPMPFRRSCRIAITNEGRRRQILRSALGRRPRPLRRHGDERHPDRRRLVRRRRRLMARPRPPSGAPAPKTTSTTPGPCARRKASTPVCRWLKARTPVRA